MNQASGLLLLALLVAADARHTAFPSLDVLKPIASNATQAEAVTQLIERQVQNRVEDFTVLVTPSLGPADKDTFKLSTRAGHVTIEGSSGVAAAMGFYYYTKEYCGCHTSWGGSQFALPDTLPSLPQSVTITTNDRFRYYQNVCTVSYSMVWWQWDRWEREIDWMAMHGINLPLAFTGQEAIWNKVFLELGLTQTELDAFFAGPAFLAWGRMGNIRGWGGPLPSSWNTQQVALQHRILKRMRDLGITPVLPAFAGFVPHGIKRLFPVAKVTPNNWGSFPENYTHVYLLDVMDPLFSIIGGSFLQQYINEFGTNHIYNTDTFNEMKPTSGDPAYLAQAGRAVYAAMTKTDPKAIWLMQGWLFQDTTFWTEERAKGLLTSVPQGHMIVLDLAAETKPHYDKLQSYFGQPFIWCMLHDYGGTVQMYGAIESVNKGPSDGRSFANSSMVGIGITPEGINQNNVMYEFMLENSWRAKPRDLQPWFSNYSTQRYGKYHPEADKGWQLLKSTVYNCTDGSWSHGFGPVVIIRTPGTRNPDMWYDMEQLLQAWDHFVNAADGLQDSPLFLYDLVDVTRECMSKLAAAVSVTMNHAYHLKDQQLFRGNSTLLLTILSDLDTVLATDEHFLLGRWIQSAKALATNEEELALYEFNARNQLTLWGPTGNIRDYANKQWAGLMKDYYLERWRLYVTELWDALIEGETFDQARFQQDTFNLVEKPFTFSRNVYPVEPTGSAVDEVKTAYKKYRPVTQMYRDVFKQMRRHSEYETQDRVKHHQGYPSFLQV